MSITARRCGAIITAGMLPGADGDNIDGPSVIAVPSWVANPLGKFYLYFANHRGTYIRMAYANDIRGPWTIYGGGVLDLADCPACDDHVASPDVYVDDAEERIVMSFHSPAVAEGGTQRSFLALSDDGLTFDALPAVVGPSYSRHFYHNGYHYMAMGALGCRMYRSLDGVTGWTLGPTILPSSDVEPFARHVAVRKEGDALRVFYTRKGDAPERIFSGLIDLRLPWLSWTVVGMDEVMRPVEVYEGANVPVAPSAPGPANNPENALRDPCIYEADGRIWMIYAGAGESCLALAELTISHPPIVQPGSVTLGPGSHSFTVPAHNSIVFEFSGPCGGGGGDNTSAGSKATGGQGPTKALIGGVNLIAGAGGSGAGDASPHNVGLAGVGDLAGLGGVSSGKGGKGGGASGGDLNVAGDDGGDSAATAGGIGSGVTGHKGGNGGNVGSGNTHGGGGGQGGHAKRTTVLTPGAVISIAVGAKGIKGTGQANGLDGSDGKAVISWQ